jgi:hypothetical protein
MTRNQISSTSTSFFLAAAILVLFGLAGVNQQGPHGVLQLGLAVVMAVAGFMLRSGTAEARLIGLGAAALTVAAGALLLISGGYYVPGTIIAVFAVFRLAQAQPGDVPAGPPHAAMPGGYPHPAPIPPQAAPFPTQAAPFPTQAPPVPPQTPAGTAPDWGYFGPPQGPADPRD